MRTHARCGTDAVIQACQQVADGPRLRLHRVDVRCLAEGREDVDRADEHLADIAVQVHPGGDDASRPDDLADRAGEVALRVVHALHRHRAVDIEKESVQRHRRLQALDQLAFHRRVGVRGDRPAGKRARLERAEPLDIVTTLERAVLEVRIARRDLFATQDPEIVQGAGQGRERAALDRDAADTDPVHACLL